jgi:uncharacterized protein DUF4386
MTRRTNARVAGFTFLIWIALGLSGDFLSDRAMRGEGTGAELAGIARHAPTARLAILLKLACCVCPLVLAVTLYSITRDRDPDLALLAMTCRVAEGVIGAAALSTSVGRLWLATAAGADAPDPAAAGALGAYLLNLPNSTSTVGAIFFAIGSTIFAFLFLRGRIVPVALAWLGVFASILIVTGLPLQLVGVLGRPMTGLMWLPMPVFAIALALWLIVRGAALPKPSPLSEEHA